MREYIEAYEHFLFAQVLWALFASSINTFIQAVHHISRVTRKPDSEITSADISD